MVVRAVLSLARIEEIVLGAVDRHGTLRTRSTRIEDFAVDKDNRSHVGTEEYDRPSRQPCKPQVYVHCVSRDRPLKVCVRF